MVKQKTLFEIENYFNLQNRRYIGNKYKLVDWIFEIINTNTQNIKVFLDLFAGTGVVSQKALQKFEKIIINDNLYSNEVIYRAFFEKGYFNFAKLIKIKNYFNSLNPIELEENYFSLNFANKYFGHNSSKIIGYIREEIENMSLTKKEYYILLASLLYSMDKVANTVGHYDAFLRNKKINDRFCFNLIKPIEHNKEVLIYREDANKLITKVSGDLAYIDPPYNSRQYSRFYHLLETVVKWDKPRLYGVALKPKPENISEYCKVTAKKVFEDLINKVDVKYIIVSYNNTYNSNSNSSKNKISLDEIESILNKKGKLKIFSKEYKFFNAGKTLFSNHKEYLFLVKVDL